MEPSLNTWTIVFLIAAFQGFFLSVMIFLRKSKVNNLLGGLTLCFSIMLLFYVAYWTGYTSKLPTAFGLLQGLTYAFGPLVYFYVRSSKKQLHFNPWHFTPLLLYVIHFLNWPNYPQSTRGSIILVQTILQNVHLLIYTVLIFHFILKNKGAYNGALKFYKWRVKVALAFTGYSLSFLTYFVLVWTNALAVEYDYMISTASSFFIYFIGYYSFQKQEVFKMYEAGKYDRSSLPTSGAKALLVKIKTIVSDQRLYLDSSLTLTKLADKTGLSQHHISQVINELEKKNFTDFINEYRIIEAKQQLTTTDHKIIHIAYDCGFNNKNSFNNAFKKITGMSPSVFRDSQPVMSA